MRYILFFLTFFLFVNTSHSNNDTDKALKDIKGTINKGLSTIESTGQEVGNVIGGTYTAFDFDEKLNVDTNVEACVKTPEIPPWYLKLEYPCELLWDQACWTERVCVSYPAGVSCKAFSCKVKWRQVCTTVKICSPPYPSGIKYCSTNWKVFPGIPQVKRCQDAKIAEIEIAGTGILKYSPEAAIFKTVLKGSYFGQGFEYGVDCKLPLSGDYQIKFDMISRKIKSIDNTDGSAYDTDIGVNVPKMDPGTLANPSELLVPAEVEVSPSYEFNLGANDDDNDGMMDEAADKGGSFDDSSVKKPKDSLKNQEDGESDASKNKKNETFRDKAMNKINKSPFCSIIDTTPSMTPPGIAADAIFNIAPLKGNLSVKVKLGITACGGSAGDFAFIFPTLAFEQTLLAIKNGGEIGVPGASVNLFPQNPVPPIMDAFVGEMNKFFDHFNRFFSKRTFEGLTKPFCDSNEVRQALQFFGIRGC